MGIVAVVIIVIILILLIMGYNAMLKKRNKVKTAFSGLDTMLKKRYDLMPNLVAMVEKYVSHESDILTRITKLRARAQSAKSIDESININKEIDDAMRALNVSVEGYPDLKSSENYLQMQAALNDVEEQISAARRTYNLNVETYNTFIGMIPINVVALIFGFKPFEQFTATEEERESKIWVNK